MAQAQKVVLGDEIVLAHRRVTLPGTPTSHSVSPASCSAPAQVDSSLLVSLAAIEAIHVDWRSGVQLRSQSVSAEQASWT